MVYVRWNLKASLVRTELGTLDTFCLEGLILPPGVLLESVPSAERKILCSGTATVFHLWETSVEWWNPSVTEQFETTPGNCIPDLAVHGYPIDCQVRMFT